MNLTGMTVGTAVLVSLVATGCGGGTQNSASSQGMASMPASAAPETAAQPTTSVQGLDVTFMTQPDPAKVGENAFEVMVMVGRQPVTDGDVSVEFVMAAMPSMGMAEMRNTVALKHGGNGRYRGTGTVAMAGAWEATVKVTRNGQELGSRKFPVTAK